MTLSYRQRVAFVGGLIGAAVGVVAALAYLNQLAPEEPAEGVEIRLRDAVKLGASTIALLRQVSDLTR